MSASAAFAPHTRGSTHYFVGLASRRLVCPAHAGVYRESAYRPSLPRRLPRTRGGLPWWVTVSSNERWFAPHTRGSTSGVYLGVSASGHMFAPHTRGSTGSVVAPIDFQQVCPAHAGVYRGLARWPHDQGRLPRTRGGLPEIAQPVAIISGFAPHTRGSTGPGRDGADYREVCPAHAGVYPPAPGCAPTPGCLPRTRGGLPHHDVSFSS